MTTPIRRSNGPRRLLRQAVLVIAAAWAAGVLVLLPAGLAVAQTISFDPSETYLTLPDSTLDPYDFTVDLVIDCGPELVKGVELKVAYDPYLVQLVEITPGGWYTGSGKDYFFFDYTGIDGAGTLHLASSVLDGAEGGAGVLAVCRFTVTGVGTCPLVFQDVDVRGAANDSLAFAHSVGDRIILEPVETTPTSFGAVKAVYR